MSDNNGPLSRHKESVKLEKIFDNTNLHALKFRYFKVLYANASNFFIVLSNSSLYSVNATGEIVKLDTGITWETRGPGIKCDVRSSDGLIAVAVNGDLYSRGGCQLKLYKNNRKIYDDRMVMIYDFKFFNDKLLLAFKYTLGLYEIEFDPRSETYCISKIRHIEARGSGRGSGAFGAPVYESVDKMINFISVGYPYVAVKYFNTYDSGGGDMYGFFLDRKTNQFEFNRIVGSMGGSLIGYDATSIVFISRNEECILYQAERKYGGKISIAKITPNLNQTRIAIEYLPPIKKPSITGDPSIAINNNVIALVDSKNISLVDLNTGNTITSKVRDEYGIGAKITDMTGDRIVLITYSGDVEIWKYSTPEKEAIASMITFERLEPKLPKDIQREIVKLSQMKHGQLKRRPEPFLLQESEEAKLIRLGAQKRLAEEQEKEIEEQQLQKLEIQKKIEEQQRRQKKIQQEEEESRKKQRKRTIKRQRETEREMEQIPWIQHSSRVPETPHFVIPERERKLAKRKGFKVIPETSQELAVRKGVIDLTDSPEPLVANDEDNNEHQRQLAEDEELARQLQQEEENNNNGRHLFF